MRKRKEKTIERLQITRVASEGKCVARHKNQYTLTKETVLGDAKFTKDKKTFMDVVATQFHNYLTFLSIPSTTNFQLRKKPKYLCVS